MTPRAVSPATSTTKSNKRTPSQNEESQMSGTVKGSSARLKTIESGTSTYMPAITAVAVRCHGAGNTVSRTSRAQT